MRLFTLLSIFLLAAVPSPAAMAADQPPTDIPVQPATYEMVDRFYTAEGVVEAVHQATLRAKTSGTVVELNFDVNDFVEKDQVLIRFRAKQNKAAADQAEAGLIEARAHLKETENQFQRIKQLYDEKMATEAKMDQMRAGLKAARARLEAARARVSGAREGVENTVMTAPYSGYVVKRFVELGESAQVGQPLFSGMSLDRLRVKATIPQRYYNAVREHARATIRIAAGDTLSLTGNALNFFSYAERGSNDFGVRIRLPEKIANLYPGMLVKTRLKVGENRRLLIPARAIVQRSELTAVHVLSDDGRVSLRQVRTGLTYGKERLVEVLAGLEEGEKVALDVVRAGSLLKRQRNPGDRP